MNQANTWFYFEPYVAISATESEVLIYNTLNGDHILSEEIKIINLVKSLLEPQNGGVILIDQSMWPCPEIADFLVICREKFLGDWIDVGLSDKKPVQFYPVVNLQTDIAKLEKDPERSLADDAIAYLEQINFYVNSSCASDCASCSFAYKQIGMCTKAESKEELPVETIFAILNSKINPLKKISISGGNIFLYSKFEELVQVIKQKNIYSEWNLYYKNIDEERLILLKYSNIMVNLFVDATVEVDIIKKILSHFSGINLALKFIVRAESDCLKFENDLLPAIGDIHYEIKLLYDYTNADFFRKYAFVSQEDILAEKQSMKDIFANQKMNRHYFGQFTIFPNGDVYANLNNKSIGNIHATPLSRLVYAEMVDGQSWLQVRDKEPCRNCVLRWLCPPPSPYEAVLNKTNLCYVK